MWDPYAELLNHSKPSYDWPIHWASYNFVLMCFTQKKTMQNTWNFLSHVRLVRFVSSNSTSIPQCHIFLFFVVYFKTLHNPIPHSMHVTYTPYPSRKTDVTIPPWRLLNAEIYLEPRTFLSMAAGLPIEQNSQHFQSFCTRSSWKILFHFGII